MNEAEYQKTFELAGAAACDLAELLVERIKLGWTQKLFARGADGECIAATKPEATCWCLLGGLQYARNVLFKHEIAFPLITLGDDLVRIELVRGIAPGEVELHTAQLGNVIAVWNDARERTQAEVIALAEGALQRLRKYAQQQAA